MRHATVAASAEVAGIVSDVCRTLGVATDKLTMRLVSKYSQSKCDDIFRFHTTAKDMLSAENSVMAVYLKERRSDHSARKYNAVARFKAISGDLKKMKKDMHKKETFVYSEIDRLKAEFEACSKYNTLVASEIDNHTNYAKEIELIDASRDAMIADITPKLALMQADIDAAKVDFIAARTLLYYHHNVLRSSVERRNRALRPTHARKYKRRRADDDAVVYGRSAPKRRCDAAKR